MENSNQEQEKAPEGQSPPIEPQEEINYYEEMKTLTEEEKSLCPNKISEFITSLYTRGLIQKLNEVGVKHIPISLYPSPIPRNLFEKIFFYQIAFNKIYNKLSNDQPFIEKILEPIASKDNYIQKLLEISKKTINFDKKQKIKLSLFRNDYILDKNQKFLFLKEYITNTKPFEFSYSNNLLQFFNYYSKKYKNIFSRYKEKYAEIPQEKGNTIEKICEAILEGIKLAFPKEKTTEIIFIVNKNKSKYDFDLEYLRNELYDKHEIKSIKLTLNEVNTKITKDEESNLILDGNKISLVYFTSEEKDDYQDDDSWKAREFLELSTAIKVPDINTFLITYKVFQYFLSKPDIIMHYNYNELILNDLLRFFGGIYYIPDKSAEERKEIFEKIKSEEDKYILKSFIDNKNEDLKSVINNIGEGEPNDELIKGIITDKYDPPEHESLIIKDDAFEVQKVFSEYSIYGIILMNDNNLIINKSVSFLVKTGINKDNLDIIDLPCLIEKKLETNLIHKVEIKAEDIKKYLDDLKAAEEEAKRKQEEEEKKRKEEEEAKRKEEEEKKEEVKPEENKEENKES